ncbi:hypothetical protein KBD61_01290 [Patescibacteria group bacterium]|nr:hypothetical protein [Patescibacteria group bacterium]
MKETSNKGITSEAEMRFEKGEARRLLHELEVAGQYIFHGSPASNITELEPRQATDYSIGEEVQHGDPSIAGTPHADIAIFRAVVNHGTTGFGKTNDIIEFQATQKALDFAQDKVGYVYVLKRTDFIPLGGNERAMEWRASQSQKPERVILVTFDDLPDNITIIEPLKGKTF